MIYVAFYWTEEAYVGEAHLEIGMISTSKERVEKFIEERSKNQHLIPPRGRVQLQIKEIEDGEEWPTW